MTASYPICVCTVECADPPSAGLLTATATPAAAPTTAAAPTFGKGGSGGHDNAPNYPQAMRGASTVPLSAVKLTEFLTNRISTHVRAYGPARRLSETQALEPYRWAARHLLGIAGIAPQISCPGGLDAVATEVACLMPSETLPQGFLSKTSPSQKLANKMSVYPRGGRQGKQVLHSPWPGEEQLPTPTQALVDVGKVAIVAQGAANPRGRTGSRVTAMAAEGEIVRPPPNLADGEVAPDVIPSLPTTSKPHRSSSII